MKYPKTTIALVLILAAAAYRVYAVYHPGISNLSPIMALAFCGGVYFTQRRLWLVPFLALGLSDLWIDHHYVVNFGYTWELGGSLMRLACFALAIGIGVLVARRRNALSLLGGVLGCSLIFYVVTNTGTWLGDAYYAKNLAGWWQALTIGHVEFPPTLWFFRNSLVGDLLFTGLFAFAMQGVAAFRLHPAKQTA